MAATTSKSTKYCIVPLCANSTLSTPNKVFISLPKGNKNNMKRRQAWLKATRRKFDLSVNTTGFVCEDHFNLEEDLENYIKFKYRKGPIILKSDVVPHIFECQQEEKDTFQEAERKASVERARRKLVDSILTMSADETSTHETCDIEAANNLCRLSQSRETGNSSLPNLIIEQRCASNEESTNVLCNPKKEMTHNYLNEHQVTKSEELSSPAGKETVLLCNFVQSIGM